MESMLPNADGETGTFLRFLCACMTQYLIIIGNTWYNFVLFVTYSEYDRWCLGEIIVDTQKNPFDGVRIMQSVYFGLRTNRVFFIFCFLVLAYTGFGVTPFSRVAASEKIYIYFYSSETNINNYKLLKMEYDAYLSQYGPYEFQPFNDRQVFEDYIKSQKKYLVLISYWHFSLIAGTFSLEPVLVGQKDGKTYQRRMLISKGKQEIQTLKTGPVASASSIQHTRSTLKEMSEIDQYADAIRILTVPKDIDALMSVGFGMSKLALATENSLEKLKMLNPALFQQINVIASGKKHLLLVLSLPTSFSDESKNVVDVIYDMPEKPEGKKKMRMLGLDGWQPVTPEIKKELLDQKIELPE